MRSPSHLRGRLAVLLVVAVVLAATTTSVSAATTPVDVSGTVDGVGPGVAVAPADGAVQGSTVGLLAENLPTAGEASAWIDDGDFSDESGTYSGSLSVSQCGNADGAGTPLVPAAFDAAQHCDGGDSRSSSFVLSPSAIDGDLLLAVTPRTGFGVFAWDDDGDAGTDPVEAPAGIGSAQATCVPVGAADVTAGAALACSYLIRDADGPVGAVFWGSAPFLFSEAPLLEIDSVTGQLPGSKAARGGDALVVSGSGWDPGSGLAAAMCDLADEFTCDPSSSTVDLFVDGSGNLSGSVPVYPLNTPGLRLLKITQTGDGQRGLAPIRILGPRAIVIDPTGGGAGDPTPVNILGADFDPLQAVTVTGSDGINPTSDVGAGVVDDNGVLTGSMVVTSPATAAIVVTEDDSPETDGASAPYSITSEVLTGEVTVSGGALSLNQSGGLIEMSPITLSGGPQASNGSIQTVTVADMRGSLSGWTVTAFASDWVDVTDPDPSNPIPSHVIPASNLSWIPTCTPAPGSTADPGDVTPGPPASLDPTIAATLCSAAPGGGGGTWVTGASLALEIPASIAAATYRATLTIVVV